MFDKVKKQLNAETEVDEYRAVLKEAVENSMGITDSGLGSEEEELFVDPDSIPASVLQKVLAAADEVDIDDLGDGELEEIISEEELSSVE